MFFSNDSPKNTRLYKAAESGGDDINLKDTNLEAYQQELKELNAKYKSELENANREIAHLKQTNEQNQELIAQLK